MTRLAYCTVCGDKATRLRYSHYGAVSCFSCRAFFRRAIEKSASYVCQKDHQAGYMCVINIQTRKKCAACRFNKCISVGMKHGISPLSASNSPSGSRGDDSHEDLNGLQGEALTESIFAIPVKDNLASISLDEMERIAELSELDRSTRISIGEALLNSLNDQHRFSWHFIKSFVLAALTGRCLEFAAVGWGYTMGIKKLTRYSMSIPEFATLNSTEQKALLLNNLDSMFNIKAGFFFQTDNAIGLAEQLERFSIFDISKLTSCKEWIPFGHMLEKVVKVPSVKWNQFFVTPWANSVEHERKFEFLVDCLGQLRLDLQSASILLIVALFSTEGLTNNQDFTSEVITKIGHLQLKFSRLLFRYLCHARGIDEARNSFPMYMKMLKNLREMSDIMKNKTIKIFPVPTVEQEMKVLDLAKIHED